MKIEQWKDIKNYEGLYQVSDYGKIKRIANGKSTYIGKILKPQIGRSRYSQITLHKNRQRKTFILHRLILEAFRCFCPSNMECRHLDGNLQNNKLNNLKWGTRSENRQDSIKHGTFFRPDNRGQKNKSAKLTNIKVKKIRYLLTLGISYTQIAKQFHVHCRTIWT